MCPDIVNKLRLLAWFGPFSCLYPICSARADPLGPITMPPAHGSLCPWVLTALAVLQQHLGAAEAMRAVKKVRRWPGRPVGI